jgi:hypothetical protein
VRATTLDDMTITFGSMVKIPDPLHGGAYPSGTGAYAARLVRRKRARVYGRA